MLGFYGGLSALRYFFRGHYAKECSVLLVYIMGPVFSSSSRRSRRSACRSSGGVVMMVLPAVRVAVASIVAAVLSRVVLLPRTTKGNP